jgi:TolB-like protein
MKAAVTFGDFDLDLASLTLRQSGRPVRIGQRAIHLLAALVEADGDTVSKPKLMDRAWPGLFVEEANLSVQISQLRRMLGQREDGHDWIVTVPGLGYRFAFDRPEATSRSDRPGLVVLPFSHDDGDADMGYFAQGLVTDLIAALAGFQSLSVISRNIAFTYRGRIVDSREVARDLGVAYLLEGSLRRDGSRLRLIADLVDGATGAQLWAERFDGQMDDVFAFQDRIVESVAARVAPSIGASETSRSRRERPTSVATYDIFLRAKADLDSETEPANRRAFSLLQRALESEPDNAAILCHAAWALEHRHTMGWEPLAEDDVEKCLLYTRRCLQHARDNARLAAQCAICLMQVGRDYAAAIAVAREAARANPIDPFVIAVAGVIALHCGSLEEAEAHLRRVLAIAPLDPDTRFALCGLAMIAVIRGEYEQALALAGHGLAVNAHFDATHWMLVAANAHLGRREEARKRLSELLRLSPGASIGKIRAGQPDMIPSRIEPVLEGLRMAGMPA